MFNNLLNQNQSFTNRWVVSYADFVTMLLAIFMVMYALSQMDVNYLKEFSQSMETAFNIPSKENLSKIFATTQTKVNFNQTEIQFKKELAEFNSIKNIVEAKLNKINDVSITREPRGLLIRLSNKVVFDRGSDIIKGESIVILDKIAGALKDISNSVIIEGHTDNIPIKTGKYPSNWELSTSRATNIIRYFIEKHNFSPARLSAVGYGEYLPVAGNDTDQGKTLNRRIDIVILSTAYKPE